jgi:alcohol dehydrogenase
MRNISGSLDKMASGMVPVIDAEVPIDNVAVELTPLQGRQVFGEIILGF